MGILEDEYEDDSAAIFSEVGDTASITPSGGQATNVSAIFRRGEVLEGSDDPRGVRAFGVLVVAPNAIPGWVPSQNDVVVIDSITYAVQAFDPPDPDRGFPEVRLELVAIDD